MEVKCKVTLADIAARCKVGVPTVSRVLNNVTSGFSVKAEIREKIIRTARELHYTPNLLAKNLQRQRTDLIMIYGYDIDWTLIPSCYPLLVTHAIRKLQGGGYHVNAAFPAENRNYLAPQMLDGALLLTNIYPELTSELRYRAIPYVIINDRGSDDESWLDLDDRQGTLLALRHFHHLGHRRIAYWGQTEGVRHNHHKSIVIRHNTYCEFMREIGREPLCSSPWEETPQLFEAVRRRQVTAVLSYDTFQASRLIESALKDGIRIPEDLSIIGFNRPKRLLEPISCRLTCIDIPAEAMGDMAAEILLNSIADPEYRANHTFTMSLDPGNTTSVNHQQDQ